MAGAFNIGPTGQSPDLRRQRFARLRKARQLRWRHRFRRLKRAVIAACAILFGALLTGLFVGGIGIEGFLLTIFAMMAAFVLLAIRTKAAIMAKMVSRKPSMPMPPTKRPVSSAPKSIAHAAMTARFRRLNR